MKSIQYLIIFSLLSFIAFNSEAVEPTLHICTVATKPTQGYNQLLHSCLYRNINIETLGYGQTFGGNGQKIICAQEYIETLPEDDVVLFVDAYDVLILEDADKILQRFIKAKHNFIIAGERYCWPLAKRCPEFPQQPTSFRYVNAGGYIGYVKAVKQVFKNLAPVKCSDDDQGILSTYYLANPDKVHIDARCVFFLTLAGVIEGELKLDFVNKQVEFSETHNRPFVIHGNGGSRPLYQWVYDNLFKD